MLKSIVMHDIDMNHVAAMERWYWQRHSPEISRRFGPWLHRHESYQPVLAPDDARALGLYNWRVTEATWREMPAEGPQGNLAFTVPPVWPLVSTCFVPAQPDNDFVGGDLQPDEKNVLRWYALYKYPKGVSFEDGEDWFLNTHAPEVSARKGLTRFFSSKVIKEKLPLPGVWPADAHPPIETLNLGWDRAVQMWFETFDDWRAAMLDNPGFTAPAWATSDRYPFVVPREDFVSSFILERPSDEFLRDSRIYL